MSLRWLLPAFAAILINGSVALAQHRPEIPPARGKGNPIPGQFVITLEERSDPRSVAREFGVEPDYVYTRVLVGFSGRMSDAARAGLLRDNRVVRIEQDREARLSAPTSAWGLDRIDQRSLPLDNAFNVVGTGRSVTAYVVDTGIRFDHQEFGGRALRGYDAIADGQNGSDCNGHGTHVAGTIGGRSYGVARDSTLVAVRVLNCEGSGTMSGVIAGLDWIAANGQLPAVVNMSLGGDAHASLDDAVRRLVTRGFTVTAAAGNEGRDACLASPARVTEAITVGASDRSDARPSWSNFGACVDIFAPGVSIPSAWHTDTTALASSSGTSMASPHVAGAVALLLEGNGRLTPSAIADRLGGAATQGVVLNAQSARNDLLFAAPFAEPSPQSGGATINGTDGDDIISPVATVQGQRLPTADDDSIYGHGGNDSLNGGAGADLLDGGAGSDRFFVDNPGERIVELADGGRDNAYTLVDYVLTAGAHVEILAPVYPSETAGLNLTGNTLPQIVLGSAGSNTLDGGGGGDELRGSGGNDRFFIRSAADRIVETADGGTDNAYSIVNYTLNAGAHVEVLAPVYPSETIGLNFTGNALPQIILGSAGSNTLDGGGGGDELRGLSGDDRFFIRSAGDRIVETADGGTDYAYSIVDYTLSPNAYVEFLAPLYSSETVGLKLTGNSLDQTVIGSAGGNTLDGRGGTDVLRGLGGRDVFAFTAPLGTGNIDAVFDFVVGDDRILLDDAVFVGLTRGALPAVAFHVGTAAANADDRIVYEPRSGRLSFDRDGAGADVAVHFATLPARLALTASNFVVD